jgi:hypothetical protein
VNGLLYEPTLEDWWNGHADFAGLDELVFCNAPVRSLDCSALRRGFKRARDALVFPPERKDESVT